MTSRSSASAVGSGGHHRLDVAVGDDVGCGLELEPVGAELPGDGLLGE